MSHICLWSWRFAAVQMGAWFGLMQAVYTSIHIYREIYGHGAQEFVKFFSVCLPIVDLVPGKTNRKKIFIVSFSFQKRDIQLSLHIYIYICVSDSLGICVWDKVTTPGLVVLALSYGFGSCRFLEFMTLKQFLQFGRISLVILGLGFFFEYYNSRVYFLYGFIFRSL